MSKKVLIVEDRVRQRTALKDALEKWNYEVFEAGTSSQARAQADLHWDELDVVVLDNDLGDPDVHGPDIAIEYREKNKSFPPEAIIYSKFNNVKYYRKALRLGAAAYLEKGDLTRVVNHVKVLALCRALNPANPTLVSRLARISAHSRTESEAILAFCSTVLTRELESCLRVPFLVLFMQDGETQNCATTPGFPTHSPVYQELQDLAHANLSGPSTLDKNKLSPAKDQATKDLYQKLNQAVLLPLSKSDKLKLSICILNEEKGRESHEHSEEEALCEVLSQYFRPTVFANIVNIWSQWTELHATRTSTAKLCLAVGQEISSGLEDPEQLQDLANDLSDTGQYLTQLGNRNASDKLENLSINAIVTAAWEDVTRAADTSDMKPPQVTHDCSVVAQKSDLEQIFSRLLQWFIYRTKSMPLDVEPVIKIDCETGESVATITFEDNSHRLPRRLREDLFAPFTQAISTPFPKIDEARPQTHGTKKKVRKGERSTENNHLNTGRYLPLYLAKMLVEGRYHGILEDHSDEIKDHSYGHRILMQFPLSDRHDQN
ncbi:MAG TPA: response regulator [Pyrinomonadaceae bacterium]|nr:response regulator [Pyrinomonadaceae bacterium]